MTDVIAGKNCITEEFSIEYVGVLAQLELSSSERRRAKDDMAGMLAYVRKLQELDTKNVEPLTHVNPMNNLFRDDVVTGDDISGKLLAGAPAGKNNMFVVPRTIDEV